MRTTRLSLVLALFASVTAVSARAADQAKPADPKSAAPKITYDDHVQAIFREHCYTCHNQNEAKSDLALDSYGRTMQGGASGEVVIAGDADNSRLYALTAHIEQPKMPPNQDKIPEAKLKTLKDWIVGGALENSGSKAKIKPKVNLTLAKSEGNKPAGPAAMPEKFRRQPFVVTTRPGTATAIAASPWAPVAAVAGQKQIMLHNTDTGELLTILEFPEGIAHVLKFSRDGSVLLAAGGRGGASGKVVLFDVKSGNRITELGDELDVVLAADVSSDLSMVALGGPKKMVRVYSVADGSLLYEMKKHTDWVYALEFSPDGVLLATADRSAGLMIWEADAGREYQNLTGHTAGITDVSWRSDSNLLASCSEDGTVKLWEMENGKMVKTWNAHGGGALTVDFAPDGNLVSGGRDKVCKLWDVNGSAKATTPAMSEMVMEAAVSYDGKKIIAGDLLGQGQIYSAVDGKPAATLRLNPLPLDQLVAYMNEQVAVADKASADAAAAADAAKKAAEARAAEIAAAAKKSNDAANEVKRLEALRPELDKQGPLKQQAKQAAAQKLQEARQQLAAAQSAEAQASRQAKQHADASAAAAAALKAATDALAKLTAEKKQAEIPAQQKKVDAAKADAEAKAKQAAASQQAAAQAVEKVKAATAAMAAATEAVTKADAEIVALQKQKTDAQNALNTLKPQLKPLADAAAKIAATKADVDKAAADKAAAAKIAADAAAAAKQAAQRAAADKAEFDKLGNSQASAK